MSQSNSNNQRHNNRNRNNNNRNNQRNKPNNNRNGKGNYNRRRKPKQKPLTWWQKFLKAIGLLPSHKKQNKKKSSSKTNLTKSRKGRPQRDDSNATYSKTRLYIGNLSYDVNDYDLEELFKGIGNIKSARVAYNRHTQKSRGYGFVEFLNPDDSTKAISILHEQYFMGRKLLVSAAREKEAASNQAAS